jgi:hypothetical protein
MALVVLVALEALAVVDSLWRISSSSLAISLEVLLVVVLEALVAAGHVSLAQVVVATFVLPLSSL